MIDINSRLVYNPYTLDTNKSSMYIVFEDTPIWEFKCTLSNLFSSKHTITKLIDNLNDSFHVGIKWANDNNINLTYPEVLSISPFTVGTVDKILYTQKVIKFKGVLFMKCNDEHNIEKYAALFNAAYREGIHYVYMENRLAQE